MPESVTDRCTKSHEYIFMLSKSSKYYYDSESIRTKLSDSTFNDSRLNNDSYENSINKNGYPGYKGFGGGLIKRKQDKQRGHSRRHNGFNERWDSMTTKEQQSLGANKRSVWSVSPSRFKQAHFATFPEKLIVDCIKAGSPENGIILDPFMGAGTTALVASKLNRHFIGFELNPDYIEIANIRLRSELGVFNKMSNIEDD